MRLRMRLKLIPGVIGLVISLSGCVGVFKPSVETRIRNVESGLISSYNARHWEGMELAERMAYHRVPGVSIAVIDNYQIQWARGYGTMQAGRSEPVTAETLFQTASVGKPVVAAAALHFVEQGVLELDRDVNQDLTSWQVPENAFTAKEKVTLRRLVSHSAGLTVPGFRGYARGEAVPTLTQILDGERPANSPSIRVDVVPGTMYRYSGGGYMVVQQLLEDVAGRPFPDIMQETVLAPWGMTASTFESPLPEDLWAIAASGHREDESAIPGRWHTYPEMGSGASMWATPSDLARFAIGVMEAYSGRSEIVLSQEMASEMLTVQIGQCGLGPVVLDDGGDLFYFIAGGANEGYRNFLLAYPKRGQGVVIMTNSDNGEALWQEIKRSASREYGWVRDNSALYLGIAAAIVLTLVGLALMRRKKGRPISN